MFDLLMVAVLIVGSVRAIRRLRHGMGGPIPDVPDAPADAEPMVTARYDDNGLATYSFSWQPPRFRGDPD
jgi:hypothetical protein